MTILNIAAYRFVEIPDTAAYRSTLKTRADALALKGTILLAPEGINFFLAGTEPAMRAFLDFLATDPAFEGRFADMTIKESWSATQPFRRMLVRLKREIITMRHPTIRPIEKRADSVDPGTLKRWLDQGHDDQGREVTLIDTRNQFEVELGTFHNAQEFGIARFGEFPEAIQQAAADPALGLAEKTVVTFCTGGIRCEKAALYMRELGMPHVLQLDGGILRYFEEVGGDHWSGECFVFDDRVALDPQLNETSTVQCYACRAVVSAQAQQSASYIEGVSCPACVGTHAGATANETAVQIEAAIPGP